MIAPSETERATVEARIRDRLATLDEVTLRELDDLLARFAGEPTPTPTHGDPHPQPLSHGERGGGDHASPVVTRRQALAALGIGGLALVGSNAATGWLSYGAGERVAADAGRTQLVAAGAETSRVREEVARLQGLLKLYETLEGIGIDAIIAAGIRAVALPLDALRLAVGGLREAVRIVDGLLSRFEGALPGIVRALDTVEKNLAWIIDDRLKALERVVNDATSRAEPLAEALGSFFTGLIERIPGSVGERIREGIARMRELIAALPVQLQPVRDVLVTPLRRDWFGPGDTGLQGGLFTPIRQTLLTPLGGFLDHVGALVESWETNLTTPVQQAIQQRNAVRDKIAAYRRENGL